MAIAKAKYIAVESVGISILELLPAVGFADLAVGQASQKWQG